MFLARWLENWTRGRRPRKPHANGNVPFGLRSTLEPLGDRIVPHASPLFFQSGASFAAPWSLVGSFGGQTGESAEVSELKVVAWSEAYAGTEIKITVAAIDANGRPVRDYTGTVALTSSDADATLPESYTFTAEDRGRHTFSITLATTGEQTVTATDAATDTVVGTATVNVTDAPVATHFFVQVERDATAGSATRVVVAALDESNRVVSDYAGTVALTASDADATLPESYTFTAGDRGVHVFEFTPSAAGEVTVTATDSATVAVAGSAIATVAEARVATKFAVIARPHAAADTETQVYVVALDDSNRIVKNYTGTVTLASSDTAAVLPEIYTFTAEDRGVRALTLTLNTEGSQTVTATDAAGLTGIATIDVGTVTAPRFGFEGFHEGFRGVFRRHR